MSFGHSRPIDKSSISSVISRSITNSDDQQPSSSTHLTDAESACMRTLSSNNNLTRVHRIRRRNDCDVRIPSYSKELSARQSTILIEERFRVNNLTPFLLQIKSIYNSRSPVNNSAAMNPAHGRDDISHLMTTNHLSSITNYLFSTRNHRRSCNRHVNAIQRQFFGRRTLLLLVSILFTVFVTLASGYNSASDSSTIYTDPAILATFHDVQDAKEVEFERMIMDRSTNRLYVGGVNHLYDITPQGLAVREHAVTGPRMDSVLCADAIGGACKEPFVSTESHTKALAIYSSQNKLIECTSLFQGRCRARNLSGIKSADETHISRPGIVPNDQPSSTVIFVGSGPTSTSSNSASVLFDDNFSSDENDIQSPSKVLYVGSTYVPVNVGPRDALDVPAVASLSLESSNRLFQFTSQSISSGTYMKLDYRRMPSFKIDYVGGFEANGFAYFATRQPKYTQINEPQPYISKLVRVCTQDTNFYSYTEAPLECTRGNEHFNIVQDISVGYPGFDLAVSLRIKPTDQVLFGVFTRGDGPERNITSKSSALCIFTIKQIEEKFFENIRMCYNGLTRTNLPWFNSDKACTATRYPDSEIMCGKDVNSYIGGGIPITATASLASRTTSFTAVTFTSVQTATVAFIGTADGMLYKALIEQDGGTSRVYKSIQLTPDAQPLLQDMELDDKNGLLYAMSKYTVYKVNIRLCSPSTDCHACMDVGDPYCGWCMRPSACTTQDVCDTDAIDPQADWLNYKSGRCPLIDSVEPSEQQITATRSLSISIKNIPPKISDFFCSFQFANNEQINVSASLKDNRVVCSTPTQNSLRAIAPPQFNVHASTIARLLVLKVDDNSVIAATNFTFYDCNQLQSCTECTGSSFPCDWCTLSAKCVPNAEDVCQGETLVNSVSRLGPSSRRGPDYCPRFGPVDSEGNSIYVASGQKRRIMVASYNLPEQATNFKCQYTVDGEDKTHEKLAHRKGDRIACEDMLFEYSNIGLGNGTAIARFGIVWSAAASAASLSTSRSSVQPSTQQHQLDNSVGMHIVLYKCEHLGSNCGICLGLEYKRFDCGWCDEEQRCMHSDDCPRESGWLTKVSGSSSGTPICPHPRIDDFYPKKGPINGGTKITINGVNLGLSYADVRDAVRVASAKCDVSEHEYVPSQRIVCYTRAPTTRQKQGQHVVFKLRDDRRYTAASAFTYTYANPAINSFQPYRGPKNGGTDVTIVGADLDSGFMFNVSIGKVPCQLLQRTSSMVVCRTGPSQNEKTEYLTLNSDGTQIKVDNVQFQYSTNPSIDAVHRAMSIISGGITVDVGGTNFELLQRPRLVVFFEGELYYGPYCEIIDDQVMACRTPSLQAAFSTERHRGHSSERPLRVDYGFDLDGTTTGNLTIDDHFSKMLVYDDPQIHKFTGLQIIRPGGDLVIKGIGLNQAANPRDIRVSVDGSACNVTALALSTLTCLLSIDLSDDLLDVVVYVGGKIENVGRVSQRAPNDVSKILIAALVIASLAVGLALLLIVLYRRKSSSHSRQLRYLKNQMNTIEMKVAQECKEAFHELQTNINALAGSVPQGCSFIPMNSYANYTAKILLPNAHPNHPALNDLHVEEDRAHQVETGLRQLHCLLQNRTFLLLFVRTIDENKYLLLKDRVYVGSLLMIILQNRMEYCTDVLKQLLKELIRRNVESKFQPKILFRRAESVAERMLSAWFSFLMYKFLTKGAGAPLYQLYWATKQQTEKGPQDALTMDARYSLSEEKLLRATFDFRELTIFVICDGICQPGTAAAYETPVRVLDCDSISQVKERCLDAKYRTIPFSERPAPGDVDLELRTPRHRLLLQDLDVTSKCESGVWRYNTLAHYKVENKATLALLCKGNTTNTTNTSSSYNLSMISDRSDRSNSFPFNHLNGGGSYNTGSPTFFGGSRTIMANAMVAFDGNTTGSLHSSGKDHHHGQPPSGTTLRVYHLVRPAADHGPQDNQGKMVTEIYLTRLLTMKGTLQKFIEDVLEVIFSTSNGICPMPPCVKYMFDFLDEQAREHGILDPEVVHAWKSNALPLRFWVNLIKNPDFIFDIQKPVKIEGSLNVVSQTLMDACSTQEHHLTKDSPSSKLLFANEIDKYKAWVQRYYAEIQQMPPIGEHEMSMLLAEESREHTAATKFPTFSALNELFVYISQNKEMIFEELNQNEFALQEQLPEKFQKLLDTLEGAPEPLVLPVAPNNGSLDNYNSKSRLMANSRFY